MQNEHAEYIRISENKDTAVLMVHGIVGTPRYFDNIIPLFPEEWSIYNILLDGHGKKVEDFCQTSMVKWKAQVSERICDMEKEYDNIIIVAHSMGTLLSMDAALKNTGKIRKMLLFAVPLKPFVKPVALTQALKVVLKRVSEDKDTELAAKKQYSIEPDRRLWKYFGFIPRYVELLKLVKDVRGKVNEINVPCSVFICGNDEMVSVKSQKYLNSNPLFTNCFLEKSSHNWFCESDFEIVKKEIEKFLNKKS